MAAQRGGVIGRRPGVHARPSWRPPRIGGSIHSNGDAAIQLATDPYDTINELATEVAGHIASSFESILLPFFRQVQRNWPQPGNAPQATGYSASRLGLHVEAAGTSIIGSVTNDAAYAGYIKQRHHGNQRAVSRVVFDPAERMSRDLVADILDRVGD